VRRPSRSFRQVTPSARGAAVSRPRTCRARGRMKRQGVEYGARREKQRCGRESAKRVDLRLGHQTRNETPTSKAERWQQGHGERKSANCDALTEKTGAVTSQACSSAGCPPGSCKQAFNVVVLCEGFSWVACVCAGVRGGRLLMAGGGGCCTFCSIMAMMTAMTESGHVTSGWGEGALGHRGRRRGVRG